MDAMITRRSRRLPIAIEGVATLLCFAVSCLYVTPLMAAEEVVGGVAIELGADPPDDGMVRFWVKDNGAGLGPEEQAQLFRVAVRLDEERAPGHGLGLSIVKRIVQKLGGSVGVESEHRPGCGCTFFFTLPVETEEA